jgi:GntR family transcriptional regulator
VQLKDQIRHAVEIGALLPGEGLPPIRTLAEQLVVNANTVVRVYRELEQEGLLVLRHGVGAFVSEFGTVVQQATARTDRVNEARRSVRALITRLRDDGLTGEEIRRLIDAELDQARTEHAGAPRGTRGGAGANTPARGRP